LKLTSLVDPGHCNVFRQGEESQLAAPELLSFDACSSKAVVLFSNERETAPLLSCSKTIIPRKSKMNTTKLIALIMTIAVALFVVAPSLSWAADDGATIYKTKCAACHGADAAGKPVAKIPSLVADDTKKASDADLTKSITEAAKHPAGIKGMPADDVKAVVTYIRSLQK
jgi:mono/diheme cytochrome c family protein